MGSLNSVPVISQAKSLAQVLGGDVEGARQTQEEFVEKGIIASQLNSLVHAAHGNTEEAERIQHAFLKDMEIFADGTPVVGHIKSGVHAAMGDQEKAREVALSSTKGTAILLSAAAGAVCGPGAAACGAAFATGALGTWDAADSAIANEERGVVKGVNDLVRGDATIGESFDTIAGFGLTAAGGAAGAKAVQKAFPKNPAKKIGSGQLLPCIPAGRRRRSVLQEEDLLDKVTFPEIDTRPLPHLLSDINFQNQTDLMSPDQLATTIYSIFMILKLISIGHPKSRPYYQEICGQAFPGEKLAFCQDQLMANLRNMDANMETGVRPNTTATFLQEQMSVLMFEMKNLVGHTNLGKNLLIAICFNYKDQTQRDQCVTNLAATLDTVKAQFDELDQAHVRTKRAVICPPSPGSAGRVFIMTDSFANNHVLGNLAGIYNQMRNRRLAYNEAQAMTRPNVRVNTFVGNDVHLLNHQPRALTNPGQRTFFVDSPEVKFVQTVKLPNGDIRVQAGRGTARIGVQVVDEFSGPYTVYEMIHFEKMSNAHISQNYVIQRPNHFG